MEHARHGRRPLGLSVIFIVGMAVGGAILTSWNGPRTHAAEKESPEKNPPDLAQLRAEVGRLKGMVPDQSHAMADVGYHYASLWFAGENENWPLADFFGSEVRSHLQWAVRIIPVRKDPQGRDVDLRAILQAVEGSSLKDLLETVRAKDKPKFEAAYRTMLESCYSCHQASGKPYLRPQVPQRPPLDLIRFDPGEPTPGK